MQYLQNSTQIVILVIATLNLVNSIESKEENCTTTYKVSCKTTSRVLLARITPLTPPIDKSPLTPIGSG